MTARLYRLEVRLKDGRILSGVYSRDGAEERKRWVLDFIDRIASWTLRTVGRKH